MKIKIFKDFIGDGFDTVNLENEINNFIQDVLISKKSYLVIQ
mgnify:CR=1 FL=1